MKKDLSVLTLALLSSASCAVAITSDISGLPICSTVMQVPAGFRATGDCDRMSPLDNCTFTLQTDSNKIVYLIESGIIKSKTFKLSSKIKGPFSLSALDTTSSTKNKIQKATGAVLKLYNDPEVYLQSNEMKCEGNSYTISVYFNSRRRAQEVIVSSLPAV